MELTQELQACPGFEILKQIRSIMIVRVMNETNISELRKALLDHSARAKNGISPFLVNPSNDESEIINVMRLIHNYLASSGTLIDHTRWIVRDLCADNPFLTECEAEVVNCFENPLSRFVRDLRNFTLHRGIPLSGPSIAKDFNGAISGYYKFDREELSKWDNWHRLSKQYMSGEKEHLFVLRIVDTYQGFVSQFHSWLERRLREVFEVELLQEKNLRDQIGEQARLDAKGSSTEK